MTNFSFIATTKSGKLKRGTITSSSAEQVRKILAGKGYDLVSCEEQETKGQVLNRNVGEMFSMIFGSKISALDKISFSHHMSVMLKAGVPIIESVEVLGIDVVNYKFSKIIAQLQSELEAGKNLSSVLEKEEFFSKSHLAILKAGEASGNVEDVLARISNDLKREYQVSKKIKGAMAYPGIVTIALVLVSGFIVVFVLPKVGEVFKQMNLKIPLPTKILLAAGELINQYFLIMLGSFIGLSIISYFIFSKTNIGQKVISKIISFIPFVKKLVHQISMARFVRTLSSLLGSGVPIAQSIEISGEVFITGHYQKIIKEAVEKVEKGVSLTTIFKEHAKHFDGLLIKMCSVGEKSGKLAEILDDVAMFYENEVDDKLENISTLVEPILMILVGFGVGGMVLSIIGPIYQMMGNLTQ
ncbi:type II secretion system F family protein [Patescibacteria group bacterium]